MGVSCPIEKQFIQYKLEQMGDDIITFGCLNDDIEWVERTAKLLGFVPIK